MRISNVAKGLVAPAAAVIATWLLMPPRAEGYALLGGALRLPQRDLRVFDNFSDPEANDNHQEDPSFPGETGAALAIWKAAVEWGSEAHGDGLGDPSQPVLGSGGANFDFAWQGRASSVGGPSDNVVSEISGGGGACSPSPRRRSPTAGGSASSPTRPSGTTGRATSCPAAATTICRASRRTSSATRSASTTRATSTRPWSRSSCSPASTSGRSKRTTRPDPGALRSALAGEAARVGLRVSGTSLTLRGAGFAATGNEVWFTRTGPLADGTPAKVAGLPSLDQGTRLQVAVPPDAGDGDVLVHAPGHGNASLSNAFPFDPSLAPCAPPVPYGTAKTTSIGTLPVLFWSGRATLRTDDFEIATSGGIPDRFGWLLSSAASAATPFQGGTLWLAAPLRRETKFQFDFFGGVVVPVPVTPALVGSRRFFQLWFQDPGDPFGVGLSDALEVAFCP
jgi:hypothetical protein